jgi:hypothetical protein
MKLAIRTFALTLVVTGIAAGAYSKKTTAGNQVVPSLCPMPTCPLNSGGCGIWK